MSGEVRLARICDSPKTPPSTPILRGGCELLPERAMRPFRCSARSPRRPGPWARAFQCQLSSWRGRRHWRQKYFECGSCGTGVRDQEQPCYRRRIHASAHLQRCHSKAFGNERCPSHDKTLETWPDLYWKSGRTKAGHQRYACKRCRSTFTVGHPARNHRRRSKNGQILKLLVHGTSLSKITEIADVALRNVYRKLDFIYDRVRSSPTGGKAICAMSPGRDMAAALLRTARR